MKIALAQLDMGFEDKGFAMKTCVELMEKAAAKEADQNPPLLLRCGSQVLQRRRCTGILPGGRRTPFPFCML